MENTYFVTITGLNHYYGKKPFEIGRIIRLIKEPDNEYDKEAIAAFLPFIDKIGYVANSTNTVYDGTISAGRLYDKIEDYAYGKVMFVTHSSAIVWFCQYHLTHFIRTRIMQRERYDHSRAFFELPEAAHRWRCRFFC